MDVPRNRLIRELRMVAQVLQRIRRSTGIILLIGESCHLPGRLLLHPQPTIDQRKLIVRRKIIRIDPLHLLILGARKLISSLLIVGISHLAMRVA